MAKQNSPSSKDPYKIELPVFVDISPDIKAKMSLNEFDQKWFINQLNYHDDVTKFELAAISEAQNALIHSNLDTVRDGVDVFLRNKNAIENVGRYEERFLSNERLTRHLVWAIKALVVFIIAFAVFFILVILPWFHNKYLSFFYESKQTSEWVQNLRDGQLHNSGIVRGGYVTYPAQAKADLKGKQKISSTSEKTNTKTR
jgi:hypothetical protein